MPPSWSRRIWGSSHGLRIHCAHRSREEHCRGLAISGFGHRASKASRCSGSTAKRTSRASTARPFINKLLFSKPYPSIQPGDGNPEFKQLSGPATCTIIDDAHERHRAEPSNFLVNNSTGSSCVNLSNRPMNPKCSASRVDHEAVAYREPSGPRRGHRRHAKAKCVRTLFTYSSTTICHREEKRPIGC